MAVLRLLMTEYRHAFRPSLEHAASFVAALLPSAAAAEAAPADADRRGKPSPGAAWGELTCQALRLLRVGSTSAWCV